MDTNPVSAANQGLRVDVCDVGSTSWTELFEIESVSEVPGFSGSSYNRTRLNQTDNRQRKSPGRVDIGKMAFKAGWVDDTNSQAFDDLYQVTMRYRLVFSDGSRFIATGFLNEAKPDAGNADGETLLSVVIECDGDEAQFKASDEGSAGTD